MLKLLAVCFACLLAARADAANYQQLYAFGGALSGDGEFPYASLAAVGGALVGTTIYGDGLGTRCAEVTDGCGVAFSVMPAGAEQTVYAFKGFPDGAAPLGSLLSVGGKLYGVTQWGGSAGCGGQFGCGTVFELAADGTETVLHAFTPAEGGGLPTGGLTAIGGTLYGTTGDATSNSGTVFALAPDGTFTLLHTFQGGSDGAGPQGGLIAVGGTLYGTTRNGGGGPCVNGCGTMYSITPGGVERVLYVFPGGSSGHFPQGGLLDVGGLLYGTSEGGLGTVFALTLSGMLAGEYSFAGSDSQGPNGGLIDAGGTLYGTSFYGGTAGCGCGTVFALTPGGAIKTVYSFRGGRDGAGPQAGLINVGGTLYGTTTYGGGGRCQQGYGCGTVFALTP